MILRLQIHCLTQLQQLTEDSAGARASSGRGGCRPPEGSHLPIQRRRLGFAAAAAAAADRVGDGMRDGGEMGGRGDHFFFLLFLVALRCG
jgi:hypothetical protein